MKKLLISCLVFLGGFISVHGQVYTGAAYYPEHTDKEQVEKDARLMKEAHFNIARMVTSPGIVWNLETEPLRWNG